MRTDPRRAFRFWPQQPPTQGRVAVGPTRFGVWFATAMLVMLIGSANYNLNLGFGLTFLLCGAALASIFQTHRTLRGIVVARLAPTPVFAGGVAHFPIQLTALTFKRNVSASFVLEDEIPGGDISLEAPLVLRAEWAAPRRGRLLPGPVILQTTWPLGLFRAWTIVDAGLECLVWPKPEGEPPDFTRGGGGEGDGESGGPGVDDFKELRPYIPGDLPQRISWKHSTRGQGLFTKEFEGMTGKAIVLDYERMGEAGMEARLSLMCAMILKAHGLGLEYALQLPTRRIDPSPDALAHKRRCLDALALFRAGNYGPGAEPMDDGAARLASSGEDA